jgi:hypothetical protein
MGRLNTVDEQRSTLRWATAYRASSAAVRHVSAVRDLRVSFGSDLRRYFALAALSRSTTAPAAMVSDAFALVFRVRVILEQAVAAAFSELLERHGLRTADLRRQSLHGYSKKQGVSIRMPLSSCVPTKVCGASCYAHDALDAAPFSVVRGAINGGIAAWYERADPALRASLLVELHRPIMRMIAAARRDAKAAASVFTRRPRIRFAHVGEFSAFPAFANTLAKHVRDQSDSEVDCVVYTRHPDAKLLDPNLFMVLFSLDESSEDRRRFVPQTARVVRSAFGGRVTDSVDVNFLEHHRWSHLEPIGTGKICPSTAPETKERTCDACRCDFCFTPKIISLGTP